MTSWLTRITTAAFMIGVAGCFAPDLGDGKIACGSDGQCPPDYVCGSDRHCWRHPGDGGASDGSCTPKTCASQKVSCGTLFDPCANVTYTCGGPCGGGGGGGGGED